jgi:hypothetical protein
MTSLSALGAGDDAGTDTGAGAGALAVVSPTGAEEEQPMMPIIYATRGPTPKQISMFESAHSNLDDLVRARYLL